MGNSLLAVRGINHKYIVVGGNIAGFLFLDILIMSQGDDIPAIEPSIPLSL